MREFKGYMHGINLGGWFSQCDHSEKRYDYFVRHDDFKRIARWGFDHVRIPVDYELILNEDGSFNESGFARLGQCIEWSEEAGLNMILDLHKTFGFSFDFGEQESGFFENEDYQERFYRLWEQFSLRFGACRDRLAFELLNEVTDKAYCDTWNRIALTCIGRIRKIEPTIRILFGGYHNNSISAVKDLAMPADENVIYNFHCYEPLVFTHQGAYWIPDMDRSFRLPITATYGEMKEYNDRYVGMQTVDYDSLPAGKSLGAEFFEDYFAQAAAIAEERGTGLYCGEYGVINLASPEDILAWYRMIHAAFEKYGIGRAAWSYKEMDFGLIDEHIKEKAEEIIALL
jgi:hypothetical protein